MEKCRINEEKNKTEVINVYENEKRIFKKCKFFNTKIY